MRLVEIDNRESAWESLSENAKKFFLHLRNPNNELKDLVGSGINIKKAIRELHERGLISLKHEDARDTNEEILPIAVSVSGVTENKAQKAITQEHFILLGDNAYSQSDSVSEKYCL